MMSQALVGSSARTHKRRDARTHLVHVHRRSEPSAQGVRGLWIEDSECANKDRVTQRRDAQLGADLAARHEVDQQERRRRDTLARVPCHVHVLGLVLGDVDPELEALCVGEEVRARLEQLGRHRNAVTT